MSMSSSPMLPIVHHIIITSTNSCGYCLLVRIDETLVSTVGTVSPSKVTSSVGRSLIVGLQAGQLRIVLDLRFGRATGGLMLDDVVFRETTKVAHVHVDVTVVFLVPCPLPECLWFTIRSSLGTTFEGRGWLGREDDGLGW